jgi:hypothetical protein
LYVAICERTFWLQQREILKGVSNYSNSKLTVP